MHVLFITMDWLAATSTASAFALIGPAACYTGVHAQAESVCQNCVLGRCTRLCSIIVLQSPWLLTSTTMARSLAYKTTKSLVTSHKSPRHEAITVVTVEALACTHHVTNDRPHYPRQFDMRTGWRRQSKWGCKVTEACCQGCSKVSCKGPHDRHKLTIPAVRWVQLTWQPLPGWYMPKMLKEHSWYEPSIRHSPLQHQKCLTSQGWGSWTSNHKKLEASILEEPKESSFNSSSKYESDLKVQDWAWDDELEEVDLILTSACTA